MIGTIVNCIAIVIGGVIGNLLKNGLKERYKEIITHALGLSVMFVGISTAIKGLLNEQANPLLFIICLVLGALIGEWLKIEVRLAKLGDYMESKLSKSSNISQSFVTSSLIFCVGTMSILGSIDSALRDDHTTLFIKSILDGTLSVILASSLGLGVVLSAASVLVYQGSITIFASALLPIITNDSLREMGIIGGILVTVIGLNLLKITKIKVGNLLPSVFIPIIYYLPYIQSLFP